MLTICLHVYMHTCICMHIPLRSWLSSSSACQMSTPCLCVLAFRSRSPCRGWVHRHTLKNDISTARNSKGAHFVMALERACASGNTTCRYVACAHVQEWEYIGTKSLISIALFFRNNFLVPETRARGFRGLCFFQYIQSAHVYSQKSQTLKLSPAWCDAAGALVSVYLCIWARFSE